MSLVPNLHQPASSDESNQPLRPAEVRKHYFLERYVIISPKRNLRPDSFANPKATHKLETPTSRNIENDESIYEIKENGQWVVKVIANGFPALTLENPLAFGKQEIVIETPEHNQEFSELTIDQIERIFEVFISRATALRKIPGIIYVVVFKNDGPEAGASIAHAHSQIMALPLVPPAVESEAAGFDRYVRSHATCPFCDIISWESAQKVRVIFEDQYIQAIAPYAASAPFGAWIMPKRHVPTFAELSPTERHSLATILKKLAARLDASNISFNYFLQDSVSGQNHHFVLKVEPRTNTWGGFELSTGLVLNPIPPEYATLWYKGEAK